MARPTLVAVLCGAGTAVLLALAGCGGAAGDLADTGAAAQPAGGGPEEDDGGGARPGEPEAVDGGSRPGAPFDIEAFENIGGPLDSFRDSVAATCGGGACTVTEVISTTEDAPEGCSVDSIEYDPPAQPEGAAPSDQLIQRGTAVTAHVSCPPEEASEEPASEEPASEEPASEEPASEEPVSGEEGGAPPTEPEG